MPLDASAIRRRAAACLLLAAALTALVGCAPAKQPAAQSQSRSASQSPAQVPATAQPPALMPVSEKRSQIASNFPAEVPVVKGRVVRGRAQGDDAWDYVMEFDADSRTVATWYQMAYGGRGWSLVDDRGVGADGLEMTFRKGTAESRITIEPLAGGSTRVTAIVGVGARVLETQ